MISAFAMLALAPLAQANIVTNFFGKAGEGDGEFQNAGALAVNHSTGEVYVIDSGANRIQRFEADGDFIGAFGSPGTGEGGGEDGEPEFQFEGTQAGIAIDQSDGSLYVIDTANDRVQKLEADGTFLDAFGTSGSAEGEFDFGFGAAGIAVDPTAPHDVYVTDTANNRIQRFDSSGAVEKAWGEAGEALGQFNSPNRIAVDSEANVYVRDSGPFFSGQVQSFDSEGNSPALVPSEILAYSPEQIAVDPTDDHLYVVQFDSEFSEQNVVELDLDLPPSEMLVETHGEGNKTLFGASGIAVVSGGDPIYVSASFQNRIAILAEAEDPTATIAAADNLSATGATLHGSVNPKGALTDYHFEYVTDAQFQIDGFASASSLPEVSKGTTAGNVSRSLSGLSPSRLYHVRLVAKQTYGPATGTSGETTFTTTAAKPTVSPSANAEVTDTVATLSSRLTPNSQATTYFFQWGATDSYGNTTAVQNAGSGPESVFASAQISGLTPSTTYHFRLVASNGSGTSEGTDHAFTTAASAPFGPCPNEEFRTGPGAGLPECRAYEQVSPVDKNGGGVSLEEDEEGNEFKLRATAVAASGSRAIFLSSARFADARSGGSTEFAAYLAQRQAGGWQTWSMFPLVTPLTPIVLRLSTPDLARTMLSSGGVLDSTPPDPIRDGLNVYLRNNETAVVSPLFGAVSPAAGFASPTTSPDLGHIVFSSLAVLTADPGIPSEPEKVYEIVDGGAPRLVSFRPDGTPFSGEARPGGETGFAKEPRSTVGAVSADGTHVFFTSEEEIWRRSDGATTALASPSTRTPADPQGVKDKFFKYATPDGNRVLFTSAEQLTDDANTGPAREGADLYRYDFEADELIDISATGGGDGAKVEGVVGFEEDAERVYYVAKGQVIPGQGTPGQANLYLWEDDGSADGTTRFIASLLPRVSELERGDDRNWRQLNDEWTARTSPDGRYLLFESEAAIPGHEGGGVKQVYRYDAEGISGAGRLDCVSCNPGGEPPLGPSFLSIFGDGNAQPWEFPRSLSQNGQVFFTSQDDLLPTDTNGKLDAYAWKDGEAHLLTSGTSSRDSYFYNASIDGSDAFIVTTEALVPQDGDDLMDLYTAHVNGGFAAQFATPPPGCSGEECRGAASQSPQGPAPLSSSFRGKEDPKPRRCPKGKRKVRTRSGKTRCVKRKSASKRKQGKQNRADHNRRASR